MEFLTIQNNQRVDISSIPVLQYEDFSSFIIDLINDNDNHCVNYYGYQDNNQIKLICCIANDTQHVIYVTSSIVDKNSELNSISKKHLSFEKFEREIHENFGINFIGHPWLKPVRYAFNRADKTKTIANYPFYTIESEELHQVGVGPIHAGVIEPGHFRFICNGEQILHLEIQLGYQHRGIEELFLQKKELIQRATLAENIAGDTVVGHSVAFANAWESLCDYTPSEALQFDRALALEHERIAIHTGDLSAICADIAYQLGNSVLGRLRTPVINYFQQWCGNRLAKSLIRPFKTNFPYNEYLSEKWFEVFDAFLPDFNEICEQIFDLPSALSRLEKTGVVKTEVAAEIGMVGVAARASNFNRDIRFSHPFGYYKNESFNSIMGKNGDVYSRSKIRMDEANQSISFIKEMLKKIPNHEIQEGEIINEPKPNSFVVSLVEGWRGEICHCAITDEKGELKHYKIKDPSFHNWLALALSVRNEGISDFPVCNKSFNLSYCGHDL
ncbi:MAG TPA: NADH dehydrogenase subunit [Bacteroidales bacterium]|nr:MAG: hypothetical protein A2W98_00175 [Bacteroidetes bacterium GWF2_33_38]OFY91583.1 MAG: hypothetical protein A2236_05930 [Bacteroidetes bacterium RIFOXYA2_FULL_33_7]HBF88570.1 NADH dehydrogenase subunit [Bacteroidales bacterium]